jgi:L-fucose mutarotase
MMIKSEILHPELLQGLAKCGHKANVLITDGNYSAVTNVAKNASVIYLNLAVDMVRSTVILEKVLKYINVEKVTLMTYPDDFNNIIELEYKKLLPQDVQIDYIDRQDFYSLAKSDDTFLVIVSGESKRFANIILTVAPVFI